jgi:hypothetical protein
MGRLVLLFAIAFTACSAGAEESEGSGPKRGIIDGAQEFDLRSPELNAVIAAIEPLQAPDYDRRRELPMIEYEGGSRNVTVFYKVRSLRGDKLVADIVRQFIRANWDAGLPKGFSASGGLAFHRNDFSPAPRAFSICYAIVNISKDEKSIRCMYSFRTQ